MRTLLAVAALALPDLPVAFPPFGCPVPAEEAPAPTCPPPPLGVAPGFVDGPTARRLVAAGVKPVDVRTPAEFAAGHVPGAVNIPHDEMEQRHRELGPPTTPLLLYCKSGKRSAVASQVLRSKGFVLLYDLQAYDRWVEGK